MSDEFMNGIGGEPENTNETPQGYTNPENSDDQNYKAPETNGETAQEYQQRSRIRRHIMDSRITVSHSMIRTILVNQITAR